MGDRTVLLRVASGTVDLGDFGVLFNAQGDGGLSTLKAAAAGGCGSTMNETANGLKLAGGTLSVALAPFGLGRIPGSRQKRRASERRLEVRLL